MKMPTIVSCSLIMSLVAGCASMPPPEPQGARAAGVAIHVETYAPLPMFAQESGTVYFVQLGDDATRGMIPASQDILACNYYRDGYAYLLNALPGRYAAIACSKAENQQPPAATMTVGSHGNYSGQIGIGRNPITMAIYFPQNVVAMTEVELRAGELAFMGFYALDTDIGLEDGDELQQYYYSRMAPGAQGRGAMTNALLGGAHYQASLRKAEKDAIARQRFERAAREHFEQSAWLATLR